MAALPSNQKLWRFIVAEAKAKYHPYPSPGASHWVHSEYVKHGGQFVEGESQVSKDDDK